MDYDKIGNFIMTERKAKKLTQAQLAEKLFVSEKTVSKWENGKGIPDTSILTNLCEILGVTVNELLNGEEISTNDYTIKAESKLLEMQNEKVKSDKRLLNAEIVISSVASIIMLILLGLAIYLIYSFNLIALGCVMIGVGVVILILCCLFCLYIEQKAGYYVCSKCGNKYIPTFKQVLFAPHVNRTRYMKCPKCHQKSWNKKVVK